MTKYVKTDRPWHVLRFGPFVIDGHDQSAIADADMAEVQAAADEVGMTLEVADFPEVGEAPIPDPLEAWRTELEDARGGAETARDEAVAAVAALRMPLEYGAAGDGIADDTAALQAFLDAGGGYIPPGTYAITATLTIPAGAQLDAHSLATFKATAAIAGPMVDTPVGTTLRNVTYGLPVLECNDLADSGFWPRRFGNLKTPRLRIRNPKLYGLVAGDPAAASVSYGGDFDVHVDRTFGAATPANSVGIWTRNASDCALWAPQGPVGFQTGVRIESVCGDWKLWNVHPWAYSNAMTTGFDDYGSGTVYHGCIADTPGNASGIGYRVRGSRARFFGCLAMLNNTGPDNTATGWYFDIAASDSYLTGCEVAGADATHRFAKDFDGAAGYDLGINIDGHTSRNVATVLTQTRRRLHRWRQQFDDSNAWTLRKAAGTILAQFNTALGSERFELLNGIRMRWYAGNFTSQTGELDPTNGNMAIGSAGSFGGGTRVLFVASGGTVPNANPVGGGILYVEAGALKYRGSGGTVTIIGAA